MSKIFILYYVLIQEFVLYMYYYAIFQEKNKNKK